MGRMWSIGERYEQFGELRYRSFDEIGKPNFKMSKSSSEAILIGLEYNCSFQDIIM